MRLRISRCLVEAIQRAANAAAPNEMCGLLFGGDDAIDAWRPTRNVSDTPDRRFEIDPAALHAAHRAARSEARRITGYVHSHPAGDPMPSPIDAAAADPDGMIWLIAAGGELHAWRATAGGALHDRFEPLALDICHIAAAPRFGHKAAVRWSTRP